MTDSTLVRHIKRINKADKDAQKAGNRAEKAFNNLGRGLVLVSKELFRPNDKVLDLVAKYMETMTLAVNVVGEYAQDMADLLPEVAEVVRDRREDQEYYSFTVVEKAIKSAARVTRRVSRVGADHLRPVEDGLEA